MFEKKATGKVDPKFFKTPFLFRKILKCKDCDEWFLCKDRTTIKLRDNKKIKVGKLVYYCKHCDQRHDAEIIHKEIYAHVIHGIVLPEIKKQPEIKSVLSTAIQNEVEALEQRVKQLTVERDGIPTL